MVKAHSSASVDISVLKGKVFSVVGYGNQGRSQALNLRDSGAEVVIGNEEDEYAKRARVDRFEVLPIRRAVEKADVILILIPDEVQAEVYQTDFAGALRAGQVLDFASGYNIHFGLISPPRDVDVIMVAPKMIGPAVRTRFNKSPIPNLVAVNQDASGHAREFALALSAMIGGSKGVSFESSFKEETELDLFSEHAVDGPGLYGIVSAYEVLVEAGFSPEMILLELYQSGEVVEIWRLAVEMGLMRQLDAHSTTSQYGQLTRGKSGGTDEVKDEYRRLLGAIDDGSFAREWREEMKRGYPKLTELKKQAYTHPINETETRLRKLLNG